MAGSSMTFEYDDGNQPRGPAGIRRLKVTWTSDDSTGAVSGTTEKIVGELIKGVTDPGSAAPTDNYDITLTDDVSVDILSATAVKKGLLDRDTANTEETYFFLLNQDTTPLSMALRPVVCSPITVAITNAGNSKNGILYLYYRPYP